MKKVFLTALVAGLVLTSCGKKSEEVVIDKNDTTVVDENSDDNENVAEVAYAGSYEGELPCADCDGIKTVIVLNEDGTYTKNQEYLGVEEPVTISESGSFLANEDNTVLTLTSNESAEEKTMVKVEDGQISILKADGTPVEGEVAEKYVLVKK